MMMQKQIATENRRKYLRFSYVWPIRFCEFNTNSPSALQTGRCKNLSRGGLKIHALTPLERHSVAVIDLDLNSLSVLIPTDEILIISERKLLAQVAWRHLNLNTGLFEAGLQFVESKRREEFEDLIERAVAIGDGSAGARTVPFTKLKRTPGLFSSAEVSRHTRESKAL